MTLTSKSMGLSFQVQQESGGGGRLRSASSNAFEHCEESASPSREINVCVRYSRKLISRGENSEEKTDN